VLAHATSVIRVKFPIDGIKVGHWTDAAAATGCTAVLFPEGTVASGEVRGGAPATREFDLLAPERSVSRLDAVIISGGSAFGLAAADGVVAHLEECGIGFPTPAGPVPIVVGMALFDLMVGDGSARPGAAEGRLAALAATSENVLVGRVGAGTGATVGKWRGWDHSVPGGLGIASAQRGELIVAAVMAVNAAGDVDDGSVSRSVADGVLDSWPESAGDGSLADGDRVNTTIGVVATNGAVNKTGCLLLAQSAHDGLARAIFPPHTRSDGDAVVAAATGGVPVDGTNLDTLRVLTVAVVERAIRNTS
jgi:L-aminopeptidase/D-esterase-like protein